MSCKNFWMFGIKQVLYTLHMRVSFHIITRNGLLLIPIVNRTLYHSWRALINSQKMRSFLRRQMFQPYTSYSAPSPARKVMVPHLMNMRWTRDKQCIRISPGVQSNHFLPVHSFAYFSITLSPGYKMQWSGIVHGFMAFSEAPRDSCTGQGV